MEILNVSSKQYVKLPKLLIIKSTPVYVTTNDSVISSFPAVDQDVEMNKSDDGLSVPNSV
jgi:hypothetical protein